MKEGGLGGERDEERRGMLGEGREGPLVYYIYFVYFILNETK